ncbi:phage baseplate assembly protein domain-containing protein [Rhizobium mayense]|uniref:Phage baseplate assembly protein n=1 Tax=Rhizobium mayense TaxID=1312184 RepID=A0ABT7JY83_9HYPH|nr:phage baseplate assembly protein [Rhizobium mayense]MDL2401246.1 phage baseplate assembly protein [Rhizobium mayense]
MDKETTDKLRGMVRRGVIKNIKDDGQMQTASIEVADGIWRDNVEIIHPYGYAGHPPEDGALAIALAVAGDQGDIVLLPIANPSKRMGNLNEGDAGIHNQHGDKMIVGNDGVINIAAGDSLKVKIGGVTFTISADGVDIEGGTVKHNGKNIGWTHTHGGVVHGGESTDAPNN